MGRTRLLLHRGVDCPISAVEEFEELADNVRRVNDSTIEVTRESLPGQQEVWTLDHA